MYRMRCGASLLALAALSVVSAPSALSQQAEGPAEVERESRQSTIIVTATKTETTLQETPLAISVISGAELAERNILEISEIAQGVPGLTFSQSPGDLPSVVIRGIGTNNANQTAEQSVGLFVDGVYKPRSRQYRDALFDVERVEVVKGAQGVVFGKNTSVGAISVVSRKPGDDLAGEVYGNYDLTFGGYTLGGAVDLPANDRLRFRLGGQYAEVGGYVSNKDGKLPESERYVLRGTMVAEPTDDVTATLMLQHSQQDTIGNAFQIVDIINPAVASYFGYTSKPFEKHVDLINTYVDGQSAPAESDTQESTDAVLTLEWNNGGKLSLTSVSAYSAMDYDNYSNVFYASSELPTHPKGHQLFTEEFRQFTQELRVNYTGDRWNGFVGLMYQDQQITFDRTIRLQSWLSPGTMTNTPFGPVDIGGFALSGTSLARLDQDLESLSVFGLATYDVTDKFSITGGLRIGNEKKDADFDVSLIDLNGMRPISFPGDLALPVDQRGMITIYELVNAFGTVPTASIDDTSVDGSLNFSYDFSHDWMAYISFAQGTKSAAFNNSTITGSFVPEPFMVDKEVARSVEIGTKGSFADGRGSINASAFYTDISDFQDSVFDADVGIAGAFVIRSFDARTYGLEVEGRLQVGDNLTLFANTALLEAEAKDTGQTLPDAPSFSGTFGAEYVYPFGDDMELELGGLVTASSTMLHRNPATMRETGAYQLADFHLAIRDASSGWSGRVEVKNAFNERYDIFSFEQPLVAATLIGSYNRPRSVMVSLRKEF